MAQTTCLPPLGEVAEQSEAGEGKRLLLEEKLAFARHEQMTDVV